MLEPLADDDARTVGPFAVEGRLGSGATGHVYMGRSPSGAAVAVRVVRAGLAADAGFRRRFAADVAAAARVRSEHVAPIVDAGTEADRPWLATEYVAGPSLREVVGERGPLPGPEVLRLAGGVADALVAIHASGLVHRDLTPGNVLLPPDGPRVIDFALARAADAAGVTVGTPAYLAPEHRRGEVGPAADVFALGVLISYLATGRTPSGQEDGADDGVPEPLRALVALCLADDPASRPAPAEIAEQCRRTRAGAADAPAATPPEPSTGNPLAYPATAPPANPLDLSTGIPADTAVGPLSTARPAPPEPPTGNPLAYPATAPPANPLDLSTGIPADAVVGPLTPAADTAAGAPAHPAGLATSAPSPGPAPAPAGPPVEPGDLAALRAAADAVALAHPHAGTDLHPGAVPDGGAGGAGHVVEPVGYGAPATAPPPPPGSERRRRRLAVLAAVILLAAAIAVPLVHDNTVEGTPVAAAERATPATEDGSPAGTPVPTCAGARNLVAGGSALQREAVTAVADAWATRCPGSTVTYTPGGSAFGLRQFAADGSDFAVSDHPLGASQGEIASAAARCAGVGAPADKKLVLQVPLVLTPIVLAYHLPGVTELRLDAPAVAGIFSGRITRWDDPAIAELNPDTRLPATAIRAVAHAGQSQSTQTFQEYLTAVGGWRLGAGPEFAGTADSLQRSDVDVLGAVRTVGGAIGYLPYALTRPTNEPVADLVTGGANGPAAGPDGYAVDAAVTVALHDSDDLTRLPDAVYRAGTDRVGDATAPYPLVHVGYVVACTEYLDQGTTASVKDFLLAALTSRAGPASGYQLPLGDLRDRLVDLVEATY